MHSLHAFFLQFFTFHNISKPAYLPKSWISPKITNVVFGPGSGVDLVKRMQARGDLQCSWMMFDHVKQMKEWTTMACHVYDSLYCKVMTIAVCDM